MQAAPFLDKVKEIVSGPREKEHWDKAAIHNRITTLWNLWLMQRPKQEYLSAYDVAMMMLLVKIARLMQTPGHQDSHIDIAGYVAIMEEVTPRG
tara:strand:+ start:2897 stop:3178 length:282 start_codon:yes stop_codon:yes gene_type:complete